MNDTYDDDDYEVGYGKPPKHSQFKPGQSGNPKGRPKGTKNKKNYVLQVLNETMIARIDGESKRISMLEGIVRSVFRDALAGKPNALRQALEWVDENEPQRSVQYVVAAPPRMTVEEWTAEYGSSASGDDDIPPITNPKPKGNA